MKNVKKAMKNWYQKGLRFECSGCAECCKDHGGYTYVYLTPSDMEAISRYLELETSDLIAEYCLQNDGLTFLKMDTCDCPFLENDRCRVYPARPTQCRTWPFWHENLQRETWFNEVVPFCPGVGKGKHYTEAEIECKVARGEEEFDDILLQDQ
ncbi:MAG: YkgJ family cysteine cluster protein [bacterium]|nr:YkgJ family cysteine cluster protein [bacterium]